MLGIYTDFKPSSLSTSATSARKMRKAIGAYKDEVEKGTYPDLDHSYEFPKDDVDKIQTWYESADLDAEAEKAKAKK